MHTLRPVHPSAGAEVRRFTEDLMNHVHQMPAAKQIGPRPTSKGAVDLTGGKLFLQDVTLQTKLVDIVERRASHVTIAWEPNRHLKLHAVLRILLRSLHTLHCFWTQRTALTSQQLQDYSMAISSLHTA